MKRVIVIGSSNTDMVVNSPVIPVPGETVIGGSFAVYQGGKGANQAVAAARAGALVTFLACVGEDSMGSAAVQGYREENIDTSNIIQTREASTGVAVILVNETDGQNSIIVTPGANHLLSPSQIENATDAFTPGSTALAQLEVPLDVVETSFRLAHENGMLTILNPAPAATLPDSLLALTDIITPNESETEHLTGIYPVDEESARTASDQLLKKVNSAVIITMGEKGAYYRNKQGEEFIIPAVHVANPVDTTAAGDVFNGYFAAMLISGQSIEDALRTANKAASKSIQRAGAQPSIPRISEL